MGVREKGRHERFHMGHLGRELSLSKAQYLYQFHLFFVYKFLQVATGIGLIPVLHSVIQACFSSYFLDTGFYYRYTKATDQV